MPLSKRLFDLLLASVLLPFLAPIILIVSLALVVSQGRPIFYVSERMKTDRDGFALWKFRTMTQDPTDSGASGGHKSARITPIGRFLRRTRIDELPQLWNIFRGDMSFVGPRPPLRRYVELRPDLYGKVLRNRPGVTGLATVAYNKEEERLLKSSISGEENEEIYLRRCVPRKAHLDLIYQRNRTICMDIHIILATLNKRMRVVPKV
jgi:lipopolysaccharide/colanic/teichoic acid biosynthesis glycosyltransferase